MLDDRSYICRVSLREKFGMFGKGKGDRYRCHLPITASDAGFCTCNTDGVKIYFDKTDGREIFNCADACFRKGFFGPSGQANQKIPKLIWQMYPVINVSSQLPGRVRVMVETWQSQNPEYTHRIFNDEDMDRFVAEEFLTEPELQTVWKNITMKIVRSDFFRLLVVYKKGGFYFDIDTTCQLPLRSWVYPIDEMIFSPENFLSQASEEAIFYAQPAPDQTLHYCNWAFGAIPGHFLLKKAVYEAARRITDPTGIDKDNFVCWLAGPCAFTTAMKDFLNNSYPPEGIRILHPMLFGADSARIKSRGGKWMPWVSHHYGSQIFRQFYTPWLAEADQVKKDWWPSKPKIKPPIRKNPPNTP